MVPKNEYGLQDFEIPARRSFPDTYAKVASPGAYRFEQNTYVDAEQQPRQVEMLRVDFYHRRAGGRSVWALAIPNGVVYC